jgi:MSHA biogenesis protein MshJ
MRQPLVKLVQGIDRLSLRERLFLLAAGVFVVGGLWEAVLATPLAARERVANDKVTELTERLSQLDAALSTAAEGLGEGEPDHAERVRALRARVAAAEEEMRVYTTDLVAPAEMRLVLEELLRRKHSLKLVSAVNRPAQPLVTDPEAEAETAQPQEQPSEAPRLYRHSLVLTLEGSYLDCLAYLAAVERLPWRLYWTRLTLAATDYPRNSIVLELTTLSLDKEWIGV